VAKSKKIVATVDHNREQQQQQQRKMNQVIPGVVRISDGHMYIVREYKEQMAGKKIPDDMVVRSANRWWFMNNKAQNFMKKSTPRCPTYNVCSHCFGSVPVHICYARSAKKVWS
jgi:hypothetical protein